MRRFRDWKIITKLMVSFIALSVLIGVVALAGYINMGKMQAGTNHMYNSNLQAIKVITSIRKNFMQVQVSTLLILDKKNFLQLSQLKESIQNATNDNNNLIEKSKSYIDSEEEQQIFNSFITNLQSYREIRTKIIALSEEGKYDEAFNKYLSNTNYFDNVLSSAGKFVDMNEKQADNAMTSATKDYNAASLFMLIVAVFAFISSISTGYIISRGISKNVNKVMEVSKLMGEGDLTQTIKSNSKDEIGELANSFSDTQNNLKTLLSRIQEMANNVASNSQELTAVTEETSQSLSQVATTINEMAEGNSSQAEMISDSSNTIIGVASSIDEATNYTIVGYEKAKSSMNSAIEGREAIEVQIKSINENNEIAKQVGAYISDLSKMAESIKGIVEEITSISSQTNLLALNATIEAARAGEHGKGFAVVADEIRKLSERTAGSTTEIAQITKNITAKVTDAVLLMDKGLIVVVEQEEATQTTKKAFNKILAAVEDVVKTSSDTVALLKNINDQSKEVEAQSVSMSAVAEQASACMEELSATTQEQLASIETMSHSSSDLSSLAQELMYEVSKFKL